MRYASIRSLDISNGENVGVSLFVQGCHFHCKNCFNTSTWDFDSGKEWNDESKKQFFNLINREFIKRITIIGGEPLAAENVSEVYKIVDEIRLSFPSKTIWLYTGYTLEQLYSPISGQLSHAAHKNENDVYKLRQKVISACDVVVDGEYIDELRDVTLHWCGSSNQRVIDVKKTFEKGEIVLWHS